jgi:hypothetical protein
MWWLFVPLAMATSVLGHALLMRIAPGRNTVIAFLTSGILTGSALLMWAWLAFGVSSVAFVAAAAAYAAFCELYLFLFTLALSSVSANILARLTASSQCAGALDTTYDSRGMVLQRLERMKGAGLLTQAGDALWVTRRGRTIVTGYRALRRAFRHEVYQGEPRMDAS